jgi:hypothetical protein
MLLFCGREGQGTQNLCKFTKKCAINYREKKNHLKNRALPFADGGFVVAGWANRSWSIRIFYSAIRNKNR